VVGEAVERGVEVDFRALAEFVVEPEAAAPSRGEQALVDDLGLGGKGVAGDAVGERLVDLVKGVLRGKSLR